MVNFTYPVLPVLPYQGPNYVPTAILDFHTVMQKPLQPTFLLKAKKRSISSDMLVSNPNSATPHITGTDVEYHRTSTFGGVTAVRNYYI